MIILAFILFVILSAAKNPGDEQCTVGKDSSVPQNDSAWA